MDEYDSAINYALQVNFKLFFIENKLFLFLFLIIYK
jgi:hypothetical protein